MLKLPTHSGFHDLFLKQPCIPYGSTSGILTDLYIPDIGSLKSFFLIKTLFVNYSLFLEANV